MHMRGGKRIVGYMARLAGVLPMLGHVQDGRYPGRWRREAASTSHCTTPSVPPRLKVHRGCVKLVKDFAFPFTPMSRKTVLICKRITGFFLALTLSAMAALALPQTQDLRGIVSNSQGNPVADARCTLTGVGLRAEGIVVTTGEHGRFEFPGLQPGQYTVTCTAARHLPVTEEGVKRLQQALPRCEIER